MASNSSRHVGRHLLHIPGPTPVPDRILRAIDTPIIDHRGPEFDRMMKQLLADMRPIFGTKGPVVVFPSSGSGAWEAAIVNCPSPGDKMVIFETGQFASLWCRMADKLKLSVDFIPTDWRRSRKRSTAWAAM